MKFGDFKSVGDVRIMEYLRRDVYRKWNYCRREMCVVGSKFGGLVLFKVF